MIQCSFEEEIDLPDGGFRYTKCMNKAEILVTSDPCYGLCYKCAYDKLAKRVKELENKTKYDVIVNTCETCVLKAINCSNGGGVTICSIDKDADTFACRFGCVPLGCPLIKNDIVIKLKKGVEVMFLTEISEPKENK